MSPKVKNIIVKTIYVILIIAMLGAFVYLSEKYKDNSKEEVKTINNFYSDLDSDKYEVINGTRFINLLRNGKSIVFVGSGNSEWSEAYIERLDNVVKKLKVDRIYYYDINNDKSQSNSNYYELKELLKGNLVTTDDDSSNLLAPSLYILENGKVLYYNIETVVMKNTDTPSSYWNSERTNKFEQELEKAISKYYLNND